jgi:hypothetical protein
VGRLGHRRLRVGRIWDAQGGQDGETGRPEWAFKEAKDHYGKGSGAGGQEVHSGQDQGLWMFTVSMIRRQEAHSGHETGGSQCRQDQGTRRLAIDRIRGQEAHSG